MKSLSDLPNEVIYEVLSYLVEKPVLCQLARTSHKFSILIRRSMTQDIDFTKFEVDSMARRYRSLILSITMDPSIARTVRTVTMFTSPEDHVSNFSHILLGMLPELRTLKFFNVSARDNTYPWFLHKNPMPSLQTIIFDGPTVGDKTLWKLMTLQGLENIAVNAIVVSGTEPPSRRIGRTSPLLSLDLGQDRLSDYFVRELLACPRALKKLRCSVPSWSKSSSTMPVEQTLEPTRHSLTELVLAPCSISWDLPRVDLSDFGLLRVLEVASCCLEVVRPCEARIGLYESLPPSLQELRIIFRTKKNIMGLDVNHFFDEWEDEIVESDEDVMDLGEDVMDTDEEATDTDGKTILEADAMETFEGQHRSYPSKHALKFNWLKELADYKAERLPNLDRVIFKGIRLGHRDAVFVDRPAKLLIPQTVAEAFDTARIDLDMQFEKVAISDDAMVDLTG